MELSTFQLQEYQKNGYLLLDAFFDQSMVAGMLKELQRIIHLDCPNRILEKNGQTRSFFAPESYSDVFDQVIKHSGLVGCASKLLGSSVYIHQTKINSKFAMEGDWWEWHRDYTFWKNDDGMPAPNVLTAMIFLNDVTEFNGPLLLIPGSQNEEDINENGNEKNDMQEDSWFASYRNSETYLSALTTDLKYTLGRDMIRKWIIQNGIYSAKGKAGSVVFFHGNVFHASSNNMSPWDRHTFLVTYNSIDNTLLPVPNPRPEFISKRTFTPLN